MAKRTNIFLRGFNLDHGTDFATFLDGMPLNLPTHGHGQGYSDMNIVIPELVQRVNYQKGVYYGRTATSRRRARHGWVFQSVTAKHRHHRRRHVGYGRVMCAASPKVGEGHLLYAGEYLHSDGPWESRQLQQVQRPAHLMTMMT